MHHKGVIVVVSRHDDCGVPPGMPKRVSARKMRRHTASWKDLLDEARDPLGFNAGPADPANSQKRASQFDLQLIRRKSLSVI